MAKILVLHGPNLNLLGQREPHLYGSLSLSQLDQKLAQLATTQGHETLSVQSNAEEKLIEVLQLAPAQGIQFILFNPSALTHSSIALRDTLLAVQLPFIEIHLTNIFAREPFRHHSYLSDIAKGIICGLGPAGYMAALQVAFDYLTEPF